MSKFFCRASLRQSSRETAFNSGAACAADELSTRAAKKLPAERTARDQIFFVSIVEDSSWRRCRTRNALKDASARHFFSDLRKQLTLAMTSKASPRFQ